MKEQGKQNLSEEEKKGSSRILMAKMILCDRCSRHTLQAEVGFCAEKSENRGEFYLVCV